MGDTNLNLGREGRSIRVRFNLDKLRRVSEGAAVPAVDLSKLG